jgi:hypothetical protein
MWPKLSGSEGMRGYRLQEDTDQRRILSPFLFLLLVLLRPRFSGGMSENPPLAFDSSFIHPGNRFDSQPRTKDENDRETR